MTKENIISFILGFVVVMLLGLVAFRSLGGGKVNPTQTMYTISSGRSSWSFVTKYEEKDGCVYFTQDIHLAKPTLIKVCGGYAIEEWR